VPVSRQQLYRQLDPEAWSEQGISPLNKLVLSIIVLSILAAILESEPLLRLAAPDYFQVLNWIFAISFSIEYTMRLWVMAEDDRYRGIKGRIRYVFRPLSIIDVLATILLWVDIVFGFPGVYGVLFRLVRVVRAFMLARNSRWGIAMRLLVVAVRQRKLELILSLGFAVTTLLVSATVLFVVEGAMQPEAFGSIPRAMWWAVATLTTVGYGDVYPVTALGKMCAAIVAVTAIAIVAMPTGIMAAAFSDAFQEIRDRSEELKGD
jgi:voltage-gated potassium channel